MMIHYETFGWITVKYMDERRQSSGNPVGSIQSEINLVNKESEFSSSTAFTEDSCFFK